MNPSAMEPFGQALLAYFQGDSAADLIVHREDGLQVPLPVSIFFRDAAQFTPIDRAAIQHCNGHVLDIGAGTGLHSLVLQQNGHPVTAIDLNPQAVDIMKQRGVTDAYCADIHDYQAGPFDTLLMLGHGIGMVETLAGLDRFLAHAHSLLNEAGQILLDSLDVRATDDPQHLAYHQTLKRAGRYVGEIRMSIEFKGQQSPPCGWLQIDPKTLTQHATAAGWPHHIIHQEKTGDHLSRLTKR